MNKRLAVFLFAIILLAYYIWMYSLLRNKSGVKPYSLTHSLRNNDRLLPRITTNVSSQLYTLSQQNKRKTFIILDYNGYSKMERNDFFLDNCLVSRDIQRIEQAHAVVIATRLLKSKAVLPKVRHEWQRWVWLLDESPYHVTDGQPFRISEFNDVYNWTMTYRSHSDVSIPYGWSFPKQLTEREPLPTNIGHQTGIIASVISNCASFYVHNHRLEYIRELNKTTRVNLFGNCGKPCNGYTDGQQLQPCPEIREHLFYLAFENANCKEYISEKMFGNAFSMGTVPVVMGASKEEYTRVAPPNSFIHVRDFATPKELGVYLKYLSENIEDYMKYHEWRKNYGTDYRIQFVDRKVWSPLCNKLNRDNGEAKSVPSVEDFWNVDNDCDGTTFW